MPHLYSHLQTNLSEELSTHIGHIFSLTSYFSAHPYLASTPFILLELLLVKTIKDLHVAKSNGHTLVIIILQSAASFNKVNCSLPLVIIFCSFDGSAFSWYLPTLWPLAICFRDSVPSTCPDLPWSLVLKSVSSLNYKCHLHVDDTFTSPAQMFFHSTSPPGYCINAFKPNTSETEVLDLSFTVLPPMFPNPVAPARNPGALYSHHSYPVNLQVLSFWPPKHSFNMPGLPISTAILPPYPPILAILSHYQLLPTTPQKHFKWSSWLYLLLLLSC